jgi:hypothetical protein
MWGMDCIRSPALDGAKSRIAPRAPAVVVEVRNILVLKLESADE